MSDKNYNIIQILEKMHKMCIALEKVSDSLTDIAETNEQIKEGIMNFLIENEEKE